MDCDLIITTRREGFRRAARHWFGTTRVPASEFTAEQRLALEAEPMLGVVRVPTGGMPGDSTHDETPRGGPAAATVAETPTEQPPAAADSELPAPEAAAPADDPSPEAPPPKGRSKGGKE